MRRLANSGFALDYMVEEEYFGVYCTLGNLGEVFSRQA